MTTPLLIHVDLSKPFVLKINASKFAINIVFTELGEEFFFHLVGFHSHKFFPT
jgi:hypothetical protein